MKTTFTLYRHPVLMRMIQARLRPNLCVFHSRLFSNESLRHRKTGVNHYKVLGVTPKSTQEQIKAAYYNLSMLFHPDKNKSVMAEAKFREISEAYEVLGNYEERKKYDKGLIPTTVIYNASDRPFTYRQRRTEDNLHANFEGKPRYTGRTPIYDFDEYYRMHYGNILREDVNRKRQQEFYRNQQAYEQQNQETTFGTYDGVMLFIMLSFVGLSVLIDSHTRNFDIVDDEKNLRIDKSIK